jgi:hypothetical protein
MTAYYLQIPAVVIPLEELELDTVTARKIYDLLRNDDWVILGREGQGPIVQYTVMSRKPNGEPEHITFMNDREIGIIDG